MPGGGPRETRLNAFLPESERQAEPPAAQRPPPAAPQEPVALSVTSVLAAASAALDAKLRDVWVRGEVSGFKAHTSGHWYFTLQDDRSGLNATMFAGDNRYVKFQPEDGMELLVRGKITIWKSQIQLNVSDMRPVGAGALQLAFDQMKRRLQAEGLFDPARKRPLPEHPRRIGIVTSLEGAALRDMVHVATSRDPSIRLLVAHARVQGDGATFDIVEALKRLDAARCDAIVVGRGGGSIDDLWAFNEEVVVRAIAKCRTPTVSAVGHETDVTLADLAADLRAATPSNAMEILVPDTESILEELDAADDRLRAAVERIVPGLHDRVDDLEARGAVAVRALVARERERLGAHGARLDALSPLATLARGYGVVTKGGKVLRRAKDARPGDDITVRLAEGKLDARIERTEEDA